MNIMVCYDGSEVAKEGLKIAKKHAKSFSGKLYLVRSMEGGPDVPKKDFDDAERELTSWRKLLIVKRVLIANRTCLCVV